MRIIAIRRDERFSPNSVEKDRLILESVCQCVCSHLQQEGKEFALRWIDEADLQADDEADLYISMGRLPETLLLLDSFEKKGRKVINRPESIRNCQRSLLEQTMRQNHIPMPSPMTDEPEANQPCWIKRGDAAAQSKDDVIYCADLKALQLAKEKFARRGIDNYVVSRHVEGDVIKFYGVNSSTSSEDASDGFFRYYYPTDDGMTKFKDEALHNGTAHHYSFDNCRLQAEASRLARLLKIDVYGGDAIIDSEGNFYIIDFNDWPSFSRCRDEAAEAIAAIAIQN